MRSYTYDVVISRADDHRPCRLVRGGTYGHATLELHKPDGKLGVDGVDVLDALIKLRTALEAEGWLLAVQGARPNAHMSGMMRDMADGDRVYLMSEAPGPYPAVDTLAPADPDHVVTLAEQAAHRRSLFRRWKPSSRGNTGDVDAPSA